MFCFNQHGFSSQFFSLRCPPRVKHFQCVPVLPQNNVNKLPGPNASNGCCDNRFVCFVMNRALWHVMHIHTIDGSTVCGLELAVVVLSIFSTVQFFHLNLLDQQNLCQCFCSRVSSCMFQFGPLTMLPPVGNWFRMSCSRTH